MKKISRTLMTSLIIAATNTSSFPQNSQKQSLEQKLVASKLVTEEKIKTSLTGLKSEILVAAPAGALKPTRGQRVAVDYTGWLEDKNAKDNKGKQFDSSIIRGKKFEFILGTNSVITGWEEAIKDMQVGEKRKVTIPGHLAYGITGVSGVIPPNATLIFEIELYSAK